MFSDMFDTPEDILGGVQNAQVLNVQQRRPKNCASFLELPALSREVNGFVGLKNQGATCYLNSLIQSLFMSPEFRNAIYNLPLCVGEDISQKSDFVDSQSKQKLLLGFQKLFGQMQSLDISSISTEELTSSFGWEANQSFQQQDIQEANRVIFDVLERALFATAVQIDPTSFYKGTIVNHITCTECQVPREREENFYDLILQVENMSCVEESFMAFITPELLNESNQLFCEICNKKCDTLKGQKVRKFPDILTLSLNRFTFDYEKLERVKLNQKYEFGIEFNIAPFLENSDIDDTSDDYNYELFTVLIHRGSAHGGHYHTYIRDFLGEGNWEEKMKQYTQEREKREQEQKEKLEQQEQEEQEKKQKEDQIKQQKQAQQQQEVQKQVQEEEITNIDESNLTAQEKRDLKKKQKQQKKQQNQKTQPAKNDKKNKNEEKQNEKKKNFVAEEYEFDDQEFPRMFNNIDLSKNWYNFNDSQVKSINVNRLQKQFGGSGSENAYILVYRKKSLAKNIPNPKLPQYIEKLINEENEKLKQERSVYEEASRHIEVYIDTHEVFQDISYTYVDGYDYEKSAQLRKIKTDCTFKELLQSLSKTTSISFDNLAILELYEHPNKYVQTVRLIDASNSDQTLEKAEVSHFSCWVYYDKSKHSEILDRLKLHIGQDQIPLKLNIICPGRAISILAFSQEKLIDLKIKLQEITSISENQQYLQNEDLVHINDSLEKEEMTLNQLKIQNDYDIILKQIDQNHQQKSDQNNSQQKNAQLSEYQQAQLQGLVSILVENSDEPGVKRFFIDYRELDLLKLLAFIKEKFSIEQSSLRRLRNLENKQLYFKDEYSKSLEELGFQEGGTRLLLERGDIPVSGNIPIKIKNSSKYKVADTENVIEVLIQDDQSLHQLKSQACKILKLDPEQHKLYKTDWMEEPIQLIANENQLIRNMSFKQQEVLVLRDNDSPIDKEFEKFSIYHTINGSSEDSKYVGDLKIKKDEHIQDLKNTILAMPYFLNLDKDSGENKVSCLRVRDMRKDGLFGQIYRRNDKKISGYNYSTNNIAVQILLKPDNLEEDDISLILRKRNCKTKTYEGNTEFIYKSSKKPTVDEFKQQISAILGLSDTNKFEIVKYFPYEFCWKVVSNQEYENLKETKKKQDQKSNKKNNKTEQKKDEKQSETDQNLKKAPYLLKDGDIIGYVLLEEKEQNDDYQTENDQKMKLWFEEEKRQKKSAASSKSKSKADQAGGFTINLDF